MIVVTGGTGFLGTELILQLLNLKKKIRIVARTKPASLPTNVEFFSCDCSDYENVLLALEGATSVYHCAAIVSFDSKCNNMMMQNNVIGTRNVVNALLHYGIARLIHVSSVAALCQKKNEKTKINETNYWEESKDNSIYGRSKYEAELEVWRGFAEGLNGAIVNPSIIVGNPNFKNGTSRFYDLAYQEFKIYSQGTCGWVGVENVATSMILLMQSNIKNERFIINENNYSYRYIQNTIADAMHKKLPTKALTPLLASIAWRVAWVVGCIKRQPPFITKQTSRTAQSIRTYSNSKFLSAFPEFKYEKIETILQRGAVHYLEIKKVLNDN